MSSLSVVDDDHIVNRHTREPKPQAGSVGGSWLREVAAGPLGAQLCGKLSQGTDQVQAAL